MTRINSSRVCSGTVDHVEREHVAALGWVVLQDRGEPSTVFRYFPRKQDLARVEQFHSLREPFIDAFRRQPPELTALEAVRAALRAALGSLDPSAEAEEAQADTIGKSRPSGRTPVVNNCPSRWATGILGSIRRNVSHGALCRPIRRAALGSRAHV